jgi:hypothetical protein
MDAHTSSSATSESNNQQSMHSLAAKLTPTLATATTATKIRTTIEHLPVICRRKMKKNGTLVLRKEATIVVVRTTESVIDDGTDWVTCVTHVSRRKRTLRHCVRVSRARCASSPDLQKKKNNESNRHGKPFDR